MRKIFIYIIQHRLKPLTAKFTEGLTINNLNKFVVRYFEDQALSGLIPVFTRTRAPFRLVLVKTGIRPSLTPALRLGLVGTRHTGALALMAQQHEVVHVIYCQSLITNIPSVLLQFFR